MHDLAPFHKSKRIRTYQECNEIHVLKGARNTDFIGSMHTGMLLCFHWNVFKYAVVFLLERI